MSLRAVLSSPLGEPVVRDIVEGRWVEPSGDADETIGEGWWALPGLVDAHSHLASDQLFQPGVFDEAMVRASDSLRAGVTLVLDKGWTDDVTIRVMDALAPNQRPDIEAAARIIAAPDGYFPGFGRQIDPADIERTTREEAAAGRGWVKLIGDWPRRGVGPVANFDEDEVRRAVTVAEEAGSRVAIHTMARDVPSIAVAAGVHSIEHGLFLTDEDVAALGKRSGMWVPTVLRVQETVAQLGDQSSGGRLLRQGLENVRNLLPMAAEAGVHVLAGTDLIGSPADVAAEAVELGAYGLSGSQIVAAVSHAAFVATGRDATFAVGAPANAVFFDADPTCELDVLAHPTAVIRLGRRI